MDRYLLKHRALHAEIVQAVGTWTPGKRIGEIGAAYGAQLLCLRETFGFDVHAFVLLENISIYCGGLQAAGVLDGQAGRGMVGVPALCRARFDSEQNRPRQDA